MIERVRALLAARVPAGFGVTEKRTQYWMNEDSAAACDIAVSGGGREFALIVHYASTEARRNTSIVHIWLYYAPEVWLVDEEQQRVWRASEDAPELVEITDQLVPVAIAGVRINVGELRGVRSE